MTPGKQFNMRFTSYFTDRRDTGSWTMLQQMLFIMRVKRYVLWLGLFLVLTRGCQLVYYRGNLSTFVQHHPEAKSYYTLAATSVKFAFPPPGSLMGVRSNTRAILKMTNCTYTYPGRDKPSLHNVSCALSLSRWDQVQHVLNRDSNYLSTSRVGIIGPNGAGKSTLVKLLTVSA